MTGFLPFCELIAARRALPGGHAVGFEISDDWLQGRTTFGGLLSALAVQAMRDIAGVAWDPGVSLRALQTSFVAPVAAGATTVEVRVLREGRNVRQVQAQLLQDGATALVALGVFASDRASRVAAIAPERPAPTFDPEQAPPRPYLAGRMPQFLQHFDLRWDAGALPWSGAGGDATRVHLRLRGEPAHAVPAELAGVMLADVCPTPIAGHFDRPTPTSSVSWALEMRPLQAPPAAEGWWRADNQVVATAGGYVNHAARLWAPSGELAALAYQVVAVFG